MIEVNPMSFPITETLSEVNGYSQYSYCSTLHTIYDAPGTVFYLMVKSPN